MNGRWENIVTYKEETRFCSFRHWQHMKLALMRVCAAVMSPEAVLQRRVKKMSDNPSVIQSFSMHDTTSLAYEPIVFTP